MAEQTVRDILVDWGLTSEAIVAMRESDLAMWDNELTESINANDFASRLERQAAMIARTTVRNALAKWQVGDLDDEDY